MTGRGTGRAAGRLAVVEAELSSVNRRQLDVNIMLPRGFGGFEPRMMEIIRESLTRGNLTGEIRLTWMPQAAQQAVRVDDVRAAAVVAALRKTAKKLSLPDDLTAADLTAIPGILVADNLEAEKAAVFPLLEKALRAALQMLCTMRRREGAALAKDLRGRLDVLAGLQQDLRKHAPRAARIYRERLHQRLTEAGLPNDLLCDERLLREVALYADRVDVTEELTRIASHIAAARRTLKDDAVVGRTLDFIAQELVREINTLGAKVNDAEAAACVVAFKSELDRIREQVQNLE